jgi:hypothetical protein
LDDFRRGLLGFRAIEFGDHINDLSLLIDHRFRIRPLIR